MPIQFRGRFAPFFLAIFSFFLASCGDHSLKKALSRFRYESTQLASVESKCQADGSAQYQPTFKKIDELFSRNFDLRNSRRIVEEDISQPIIQNYTLGQPLVVSHDIIEEKMQKIDRILTQLESRSDLPMNDQSDELLDLRAHVLRMQFNDCRQKELKLRSLDDPRAFLFLQDHCETRECYREALENPASKPAMKRSLEEMCRQIFPKEHCAIQLEIHGRKKSLDEFLITTKSRYLNEKYAEFYLLRQDSLKNKFFCQKEGIKTKIGIQISSSGASAVPLSQIVIWLKNKWDNELFSFEFEIMDEKSIVDAKKRPLLINWVNSSVSFVDWTKPNVVHLSNIISESQLSLVAPHEFGHYVGFPDCYVEFMNQKSEYVYFELPSKKNIMCSLNKGHVVPQYYREQIEQNLCQY